MRFFRSTPEIDVVGPSKMSPQPPKAPFFKWCNFLGLLSLLPDRLKQIFLPIGYPHSVSSDYLAYQFWDTIQDLSSHLSRAIGKATFLAATMQQPGPDADARGSSDLQLLDLSVNIAVLMTVREICRKLSPLLLGSFKRISIDADCKKWRFLADCAYDLVIFIEICLSLLPAGAVAPVTCFASALEGLVGMLGSSTRAAIVAHHARANNTADVTAKEACQLNCAQVLCLALTCTLLPLLAQNRGSVFAMFFACAALHIYANVRAQRCLELRTLNAARLLICMRKFCASEGQPSVPSVSEANRLESICFGFGIRDVDVCGFKIRVGAPPLRQELVDGNQDLQGYFAKSFLILLNLDEKQVDILVHENIAANPTQLFEAHVRALITAKRCDYSTDAEVVHPMSAPITAEVEKFTALMVAAGYEVENVSLACGEWRFEDKIKEN